MRLLRVEEVSDRLGLKPATIRKMIYLRQLPVVRPTKRAVRIREEDVQALIRLGYQARREDQWEEKKTASARINKTPRRVEPTGLKGNNDHGTTRQ